MQPLWRDTLPGVRDLFLRLPKPKTLANSQGAKSGAGIGFRAWRWHSRAPDQMRSCVSGRLAIKRS